MILIDKAEDRDVEAIHSLGETVSGFSVNDETVTFWPKDILAQAINSSDTCILVAKIDQQIVGFIVANLNLSLRKAIVENVYVRPENRGAGVGGRLLDKLFATLKDMATEYVCTLIPLGAEDASHLYLSAGFSKGESFLWLDKSLSGTFSNRQ